jgi:1,2-diacylglycerol 3-alpha-glucosyltransferase
MRIALFSECYSPVANGVVTSVATLRNELRLQGHRVFLFAPGTHQPGDDEDIYRLPELPFPRHPYHMARPFPRLHFDFAALGAEVIHCHHPFTVGRMGADIAHKHNLPLVYTAHSLYDSMAQNAKSPLVRTMSEKAAIGVVKRFCSKADYVITPSRYTRDALKANGITNRFAVIPSGVTASSAPEGARERMREKLGVAPDCPLMLFIGRLGPEKHVDILINMVKLLQDRQLSGNRGRFKLALVGDGMSREELEQMGADLGISDRLIFLGERPHAEVGEFYAAADLFTFSSPSETQGLVLVEAMLAGLPCIAADYGGPREIVLQNETGIRVPLDPKAFALAAERLLLNPREAKRMGQSGMKRAERYSPQSMASAVLEVYESVIRLPRRSPRTKKPLIPRNLTKSSDVRVKATRRRAR